MSNFKQPEVLREVGKIVSKDKRHVLQVKHLVYEVDGQKYPKLNISIYPQDQDGFPSSKPKILNLPIEMSENLSKSVLTLYQEHTPQK